MPHLGVMTATCLSAALLLGGCSGSPFYQRTDSEAGSSIVYDQSVLRALERIITVCGDPTLQPGDDRFSGESFFLSNCRSGGGEHDLTPLVEGQPQPQRLQNMALLLGTIDEPLATPIPTGVRGFEVRRQARLLSWLIPAFERGLNQERIPEPVRQGLLAFVRPLLASAQCEFVANVGIDLLPLRLMNVRLSWHRVQGTARLRLRAAFPEAPPEARANLTSNINCLGSTRNFANSLLHLFLPDGTHDVNLAMANLTVDYEIAVALPAAGQANNTLRVALRDLTFTTTRVDIQPIGNPVGDTMMADALKETNLTAVSVAQRVEQRLRPALEPLGERLAVILLDSLDLAATPDRPEREVVGVEAEPSGIANEDQIRFEARRTDKICYTIPGLGLNCVDPIDPGQSDQTCFPVPKLGIICIPKIKPRRP